MKKVLGCIRRACEDFDLIQDGDRIGVGVSGGKDSLLLLYALSLYRRFARQRFEVVALTLSMGLEPFDVSPIQALCDRLGVEYIVRKTEIGHIIFDVRKEKNPCSLCAKMRRGALHGLAVQQGCNKLALGHHFDDAVETLFLNLFYEGRLGCFSPVTWLSRAQLTTIRPMIYVEERDIRALVKREGYPVYRNPCCADGNTKRQEIKELLERLERENPGLRLRAMGALQRAGLDGWHQPQLGRKV